ncbi:hypothetical protein J4436_01045 [Candidatus Woesearchaeota archaeon]|nr:hypothetical protein [Candidatus Woesearchaeota archaeon]
MITSIQIHENLKQELNLLKRNPKESYEEVITRLIFEVERQKRTQKHLLIKGYKEMASENLKLTKEWESTEEGWD